LYQHIFLDLDHTLWDYERNAAETLNELFEVYQLREQGVESASVFVEAFRKINAHIWHLYDRNLISQQELRHKRFRMVFDNCGIYDHSHCDSINDDFLRICPKKPHLIDGALSILTYLHAKYPLHLVTNGFDEIQSIKIRESGIAHYFEEMFTSQRAKAKKPDPQIFKYALNHLHISEKQVIMIGDNPETDLKGAIEAGIDTIYFNPDNTPSPYRPTHEIKKLGEIVKFL
jgi:YjjG family noncanonical pyrimidine nucleotidase